MLVVLGLNRGWDCNAAAVGSDSMSDMLQQLKLPDSMDPENF